MTPSATPMLIDDPGRVEASETVRFGVDGSAYEIELSAEHASELRSMVGRYISVARRIRPGPSRARQQPPPGPRLASSGDATGKPPGSAGTPRAAQREPAATVSVAATEVDVRGGEHGLTDPERQELRTIAGIAKPGRKIMAGRLRTKGFADRDSAGIWWLTDAGRRELMS
jgi:hypothetical protein